MISIELSEKELNLAKEIAKARNKTQRDGKRRDGKVVKDSLGIDIQGATAELAVSKAFGIDWDGQHFDLEAWEKWRKEGHDVSGLEVRSTKYKTGSLIIHPKDKDFSPFVLVLTYDKPTYHIVGWAYGIDGKKQDYWKDVGYGRPCYYMPQKDLRAVDNLPIKKK